MKLIFPIGKGDYEGMKRKVLHCLLLFICCISLETPVLFAKSTPKLNGDKKWRIGYYEGGAYSDYTDTMRTLVKSLIGLGWIREKNFPQYHGDIVKPYYEWLKQCNSPYLSFAAEDGYSASWDNQKRMKIRENLLKKLKEGKLDLVIAMGTWAGLDLANHEHNVPILVLSTSNPIESGIIKSSHNSGYEHVTARVDPNRYLRQLRMFHRLVGFNSLGIAYEDSPDGKVYSAMKEVRQIADERGFDLVTCRVKDTVADTDISDHSCLKCFNQLSQSSEAVYVTALTCVDRKIYEIAEIFKEHSVPSFAMIGSKYVKAGLMLSLSSDSGYNELGKYNALKFGEILNGTRPGDLEQVFEDPLDIAVNLETIQKIGFTMPGSIIKIAAEVYH